MPAFTAISPDKLARLLGTRAAPAIVDLTSEEERIPASLRRPAETVAQWAAGFAGRDVVVACSDGGQCSTGVAALLRSAHVQAEILEGGLAAWREARLPVVRQSKLEMRDPQGRTMWVTRARPKVDRIACPWLIRRFIDPEAVFLFVAPNQVLSVAERFAATPFDIEGAFLSDQGDRCSFDAILDEFGLRAIEALDRLSVIVRGADTGRLDLAPQAAGLLAAALGLSRMHSDDLEQLEDGMVLHDALYRWCRDAAEETHDPVSHASRSRRS